jgi:tetratricopeptide (TPR) repeat protein
MPARSLALPSAHPPSPTLLRLPAGPIARAAAALAGLALALPLAGAATTAPQAAVAPESVLNSSLDAPLFYQLMIGELELRQGEPGAAYEVVLDAARRTKDAQLFRRATDIALEARAGEQAVTAARAWRNTLPQSTEAQRYLVQILIALNRSADAVEPMQSLLNLTPVQERPGLIASLPRFFGRGNERKQAGTVLEQVLGPYVNAPATRVPALVAEGRGWLLADDPKRALDLAQRAHALDGAADDPALLALELMPSTPAAEAIVREHLQARPTSTGMRLLYARLLAGAQRYPDAIAQLEAVTREQPALAQPWLSLGALQLELRQSKDAEAALQKYVALVEAGPAKDTQPDEDDAPASRDEALTQAWLMLAQAAEQRGDYAAAEQSLAKIDDPKRALDVQVRRASLLARQGKVKEARDLVRAVPERGPDDARGKLLAEAQVLRDVKQWGDAYAVLARASQQYPDDADLLYEQSMMAEKLDRMDDMERLLRRVIQLKPDHQHAYNALGYSLAERNVRLPEAKSLIERALALAPNEPFITDSLGWVEYRLGHKDEALRLLRKAYAARPDTEIGAHLGEVLWVTGQREEAKRIWDEARKRDNANDVLRETLVRLRVEQ